MSGGGTAVLGVLAAIANLAPELIRAHVNLLVLTSVLALSKFTRVHRRKSREWCVLVHVSTHILPSFQQGTFVWSRTAYLPAVHSSHHMQPWSPGLRSGELDAWQGYRSTEARQYGERPVCANWTGATICGLTASQFPFYVTTTLTQTLLTCITCLCLRLD